MLSIMTISFKQWLVENGGMAIGSNGTNSHPTQSAQAAQKVAAGWLGQDANANSAAKLARSGSSSVGTQNIMQAAADATEAAPNTIASKTDATQVASALAKSFGIKNNFSKPKFMRKK